MNKTKSMEHLGSDILITPFFSADEWDTLDMQLVPPGVPYRNETVDLALAKEVENLQQALIVRLLTPQGSLKALGHKRYGSRLHELIGLENVEATRLRARVYVIQAIRQEHRVEKIISLEIKPQTSNSRDQLRIYIRIQPVGGGNPVDLGLEVGL